MSTQASLVVHNNKGQCVLNVYIDPNDIGMENELADLYRLHGALEVTVKPFVALSHPAERSDLLQQIAQLDHFNITMRREVALLKAEMRELATIITKQGEDFRESLQAD